MTATVQYQIATYSGEVTVFNLPDDAEDDFIIAKAKRILANGTSLPFGYERFDVVRQEAANDQR